VFLSAGVQERAWEEGRRRETEGQRLGMTHTYGMDPAKGMTNHRLGALAELAMATFLNVPWEPSEGATKEPDLPPDWQVRATDKARGSLIVRGNDPEEHRYALVIQDSPGWFLVVGWIRGKHAKRDEYRRAAAGRPAAWFVPQGALRTF
jgi:hypothetical protein